jgi:hypothetical protein
MIAGGLIASRTYAGLFVSSRDRIHSGDMWCWSCSSFHALVAAGMHPRTWDWEGPSTLVALHSIYTGSEIPYPELLMNNLPLNPSAQSVQ